MFSFNYYTPTKVVFGRNTEGKAAELIREFGGKKVLIHYGGGSVVRSGLLKRVTDTLDAAAIPYVTLGGAVPNPRLGLVGLIAIPTRFCIEPIFLTPVNLSIVAPLVLFP